MKFQIKREIPFWIILFIPILYQIYNWSFIPDNIPVHFNLKGEADRYDSKQSFLTFIIIISITLYLLLLFVPKIDPKKRISEMGEKYHYLRFATTFLISFIFTLITLNAIDEEFKLQPYLGLFFGLLFILLGNYFRNLKPNYFIGIRTPWTLENESVWKITHQFSSILWVIGGTIMLLTNIFSQNEPVSWYINIAIIGILTIVPILYSYLKYRKLN